MIRTMTTAGSSPTGWTPRGRRKRLAFQHHSWPSMLAEMSERMGWKRYPLRLVAPLARVFLARRAAYRDAPGIYADLWGAIAARDWAIPA